MAVVMLRTADGRQAMLAFTGLDSLQAWQAGRPAGADHPGPARRDGADRGGGRRAGRLRRTGRLVIEGEVLDSLAAGHRLVETADGEFGWAIPAPE